MGVDPRTGVNDAHYRPPFRFTGKLAKLTVKLGRPQPRPEIVEMEKRLMERAVQLERARDERRAHRGGAMARMVLDSDKRRVTI